jgi:NAD(P)H dehydrogenase (quinone)
MAASSIAKDGTIRLPFGSARTSPISASDVARVISTILEDPTGHLGKVYELTGPRSEDMNEMAKEYVTTLNRPVKNTISDLGYNRDLAVIEEKGTDEHIELGQTFSSCYFYHQTHYAAL